MAPSDEASGPEPAAPTPPPYPAPSPTPPPYPGPPPPAAPPYPGPPPPAAPPYPTPPAGTTPAAPPYPTAPPQAAAWPPPPGPPVPPQAGGLPPNPGPGPVPAPGFSHPDDVRYAQRRVHLRSRQRTTDLNAVGRLLLRLPSALCGLALVKALADWLVPGPTWIPVLVWLLCGALVFHRPTENLYARYVLRLRRPTLPEATRLETVWRAVAAEAGVEHSRYELWVKDSDALNAQAAAGHIVGVTRHAVQHVPDTRLAAVLAHELGHHTGGHAWSSLLGTWYALPARLVWGALRLVAVVVGTRLPGCLAFLVMTCFGGLLLAMLLTFWPLVVVLLVGALLLAALDRRADLRADRYAAELGFARPLTEVLYATYQERLARTGPSPAKGTAAAERAALGRVFASHAPLEKRLRHLSPYH